MTTPVARKRRLCDVCGGLDAAPRHTTGVPSDFAGSVPDTAFFDALPDGCPASAIAELMDPTTLVRHIDCCASRGCATCLQTTTLTNSAHGDALVTAIESGVTDHLSHDTVPAEVGPATGSTP